MTTSSPSTHDRAYAVVQASELPWRPSNQMRVDNVDLARTLDCQHLGARYWRLAPGQASTRHRHSLSEELYIVVSGIGRMRCGDDPQAPALTLLPGSAVRVAPHEVRQVFNDSEVMTTWLIVGAPVEPANSLEMDDETLAFIYPDGPQALPREISAQAAPYSESGWITALDHIVVRTVDLDRLCNWYESILGMRRVTSAEGRTLLMFGGQKINVHGPHEDIEIIAASPTPGSADICLLTHRSIDDLVAHCAAHGVEVEIGPVERAGALGRLMSVYMRDPDGNLVEVSAQLDG